MMKSRKVRVIYILLFLLCVGLTFFVIFKNNDISIILDNITKSDFKFILVGLFCMFIYINGEGINIRRVLKTCGHKISYFDSFKYASVGFFFSSITPSSTGGDPAQLYFMANDGLPISHSALALLVELSSFQAALCILSFAGLIFNHRILLNSIGCYKYFLFLGMAINILYLLFLVIIIFSKALIIKILDFLYKILEKFKYKKRDVFHEKCLKQIDEYHKCSIYLKNHKIVLIKVFLTTLVQMIVYYSIPYFVFKSLGLRGINIFTFIFMQVSLSMAVSYMPMPGSVGASEGGFMMMFKNLFSLETLSSAMLISRGVSFYFFVIFTGLFIICIVFYKRLCKKFKSNGV